MGHPIKNNILLMDRAKKLEARSNFQLRFVCLNDRAYDSDVDILGTNVVRRRYHSDVDIWLQALVIVKAPNSSLTIAPVDLILRNDDLYTITIVGARNGML
jgi:hypothetical protein